jgi:hypothetical protein
LIYQPFLHAALLCYISNSSFGYQYNTFIQGKAVIVTCGCKEEIDQVKIVYQGDFVPSVVQGLKGVP